MLICTLGIRASYYAHNQPNAYTVCQLLLLDASGQDTVACAPLCCLP